MAELSFQTLSFKKEKERVKVVLLGLFYFYLEKKELEEIGKFKVRENKLIFEGVSQAKAERKFNFLLSKRIGELRNILNDNPTVYVHQNSGIPLIGHISFGLIYRNTSTIEVRPATVCNLNCIYCSVGEGINSRKTDFVIEKDYLVQEFKKLIDFVGEPVEAHIGSRGEPFLYGDILPLIKDFHSLEQVETISIDTNGTLLSKKIIDEVALLPKVRLNISLNSFNPEIAQKMADCAYEVKKIIRTIEYAQEKGAKVLVAPLLLPGYNEEEMEKIVKWAKENKLPLGIQNFLEYEMGRNPTKSWSWERFYGFLKKLEGKYGIKLIYKAEDFGIEYTKKLPKPFKKGEVVTVEIVGPDRTKNSRIAAAGERVISLPGCDLPTGKKVRVRITRDKHNIFVGKTV